MTKKEAIYLMKQGVKITHKYFSKDEWMTMDKFDNIILEDGVIIGSYDFWSYTREDYWNDGYKIYK